MFRKNKCMAMQAIVLFTLFFATFPLYATTKTDTPDYSRLYQVILEQVGKARSIHPQALFHAIVVAERLYAKNGDEEYKKLAIDYLHKSLEGLKEKDGKPLLDFHIYRSFALACYEMQKQGLLSNEDNQKILPFVVKRLNVFIESFGEKARADPYGDWNIRLGNVTGSAALALYLKSIGAKSELYKKTEGYLAEYWVHLVNTGDLDENASSYTMLGQAFMLDLAKLLGKMNDVATSESFRRMFYRQAQLSSPSGIIPEFGDSYFSYNPNLIDYCYILETAARIYNDPELLRNVNTNFKGAFKIAEQGKLAHDIWYRGFGLMELDSLGTFKNTTQKNGSLPISQVTKRNRFRDGKLEKDLFDKVIMKTGNNPGSAMLMMDLYADGSHSHMEKGASVGYYEVNGIPLYHNMGRHGARSAITGNIFWVLSNKTKFPGLWNENEWFTMNIPLDYIWKNKDGSYFLARHILFRNFQEVSKDVKYMYLDNARLEGTAGTLLVDGFESSNTWHGDVKNAKDIELVQDEDATEGQYSQRVNWGVLPSGYCTRIFENKRLFNFSGDDYQNFCFDVKYTGVRPYMHLRNVCIQVDLGDQLLRPKVKSAKIEQRGRDVYAEIHFKNYSLGNADVIRRIVLTEEGCIIIQDTCIPSAKMKNWNGGQLWQLYNMGEKGDGWYSSMDEGKYESATDGKYGMIVKYEIDEKTKPFCEEIKQHYLNASPLKRNGTEFYTTGSVREMNGSKPQVFLMAVMPYPSTEKPQDYAENILLNTNSQKKSNITFAVDPLNIKQIRVSISPEAWDIVR